MSRRPLPDADDFPALIRTAFDALPGPDEARLAAIGERLETQLAGPSKRRDNHWLWLWLLLAGGTVAAAWWAGDMIQRKEITVSRQSTPTTGSPAASGERTDASDDNNNVTGEEKSESPNDHEAGPIIYQRENF
ncbi:MAG: hypothetical protein U5P41_04350 [Gammaproteobacteria bacterium]|nr:hypothetical protein [Gammaproteobacteria bacterium]